MDKLEKKTLKTARGFDYTYYITPASPGAPVPAPVLYFMHGWPDHAYMWDEVIACLQAKESESGVSKGSYRFLAPDMLGYDGTSKPTDPAAYNYVGQVADLTEILDAEEIQQVIVVGHDWGAIAAQRLYMHRPERVSGIILVSAVWIPPNLDPNEPPFNLDRWNAEMEAVFGYPLGAYWELSASPDGPEMMNSNLEKLYEAMHGDQPDWMKQIFCTRGALQAYLKGEHPLNGKVALKPYAQKQVWRDRFMERLRRDGLDAPLQWYVALAKEVQRVTDKTIPVERLTARVPVLYVGSTGDAVCRHEMIHPSIEKGLLPDVEVHIVEAGHWIPMEKPEELGGYMWGFLEKKFPVSK